VKEFIQKSGARIYHDNSVGGRGGLGEFLGSRSPSAAPGVPGKEGKVEEGSGGSGGIGYQ